MPLQVHSPVASGRRVTRQHLLPPILPLTLMRCARQRLQEKARRLTRISNRPWSLEASKPLRVTVCREHREVAKTLRNDSALC